MKYACFFGQFIGSLHRAIQFFKLQKYIDSVYEIYVLELSQLGKVLKSGRGPHSIHGFFLPPYSNIVEL